MIFNLGPMSLIGILPTDIEWSSNGTSWTAMTTAGVSNSNYEFFYDSSSKNWMIVLKTNGYLRFKNNISSSKAITALVGGGGGGGNGDHAPNPISYQAGGTGGGGGTVLQPSINYIKNNIYYITIGAGKSAGTAGDNTILKNNTSSEILATAAGGAAGISAQYNTSTGGLVSSSGHGNGGNNGARNSTGNSQATNGGDGTLLFSDSIFNSSWENAYYGPGGGGGCGGIQTSWNNISYKSENGQTPGGGGGGGGATYGKGGGATTFSTSQTPVYGSNGQISYYDYSITVTNKQYSPPKPGKTNFGGGGGGGGSWTAISTDSGFSNTTGAAGGSGVFIIRYIN